MLVSGSAPLSRDIAEFFAAANLPIMEGYGLTETSAANFVNRLGKLKIGTVGQPLGDLECKIDSDGEVLLRGKPVMRGYHNLPKETAEAFTDDGFFRTGDIGELDADGYLKITDRKKDLVKTSGGKYIAPSAHRGHVQGRVPVHLAGGGRRPGPQLRHHADQPRRGRDQGVGGGRPAGRQELRGDRRRAGDGEADRRLHRAS